MQDFNEMKKDKAKRITGFFGILVALILVFSGVLTDISMKDDNLIQSRNNSMAQIQKQKKNSIDMIVVGDSLSYSAISPMQLWNSYGYSSFVCAQSGQRIQETYSMLQTAFENLQSLFPDFPLSRCVEASSFWKTILRAGIQWIFDSRREKGVRQGRDLYGTPSENGKDRCRNFRLYGQDYGSLRKE